MQIDKNELISNFKKLPPLSGNLQQVLQFLNDQHSNWAKIDKVMLKDPVLTGRVLQVANSSFYGLPRQIKDIEIACKVLGAETLRGLVYTLILLSRFRHGDAQSPLDYDKLWRHSLRVACLVKKISHRHHLDQTLAFTLGLFHCLDLIIQDYFLKDLLAERIANHQQEAAAEQKIFSMLDSDYWWLIAILLEHWQFPVAIVASFQNPDHQPAAHVQNTTQLQSTVHLQTIVLASSLAIRHLPDDKELPEAISAQIAQLFLLKSLPLLELQNCIYDSESVYQEMESWMFA